MTEHRREDVLRGRHNHCNCRMLQVTLTDEEKAILSDCNRISVSRGIQFGLLGTIISPVLARMGIGKTSLGRIMGLGLLGYIGGRLSYSNTCQQRILQLENSPLAESLRKGGRGFQAMKDMAQVSQAPASTEDDTPAEPTRIVTSDDYRADNVDVDHNKQSVGLDDSLRPDVDKDSVRVHRVEEESSPSFTTYQDLRQQNRAEYEQKLRPPPRAPASFHGSDLSPQESGVYSSRKRKETEDTPSSTRQKPQRVNKYGDVIED